MKETKTKKKEAPKKQTKKQSFAKGVKSELKKVKWPERKEVIKYTIATVIFIIIFVALFAVLDLALSFVKGLF